MSELANYSIETDHTVLLSFTDGRKLRVPVGQLAHHLTKPDLERVRASLKLRRDFIRRHMPKVALVVAATGLIGILTVGSKAVAQLINPPQPKTEQEKTEIVRNQLPPTPSASPLPSPAVKGASTVAAAETPKPKAGPKSKSKSLLHKIIAPITGPKTSPTPSPSSTVTPNPVVEGTQPQATPLPTPQIPNQGDVLGCQAPDPCTDDKKDPGPLAGTTPLIP